MLTFVTPTLLAGDRSLVNVVVHEIVHRYVEHRIALGLDPSAPDSLCSWMGNLVTNKTWEHFWLNEGVWGRVAVRTAVCGRADKYNNLPNVGFTVFCERKILGHLHGEPVRQMAHLGGESGL